ncbi:MAG: DNA repair protein RecN [Anaerolineales bacterium]|nr:DNA repair protein RecN [Anaerolineales bacterium]MDW8446771.1 DNA repair protein RecN [Anaerolineales bacterium]
MLEELRISNFAIIEELVLHFQPGLVILTGETGAGKSILVDALETLVGGKADINYIRSGAEKAIIEGDFLLPESIRNPVLEILRREELEEQSDYLSLCREIRANGRHVARINGRVVSLATLREISEYLVDIHGQSEHLSLLKPSQHLRLLDNYAKNEDLRSAYQQIYYELMELRQKLSQLRQLERDAAHRFDLLQYQVSEIEHARLKIGEEETLLAERNRLANAENLAALVQQCILLLDEGAPEQPSVIEQIGQVIHLLGSLVRLDNSQNPLLERAEEIFENLNDLTQTLRQYGEEIEYNPRRLDLIEERLNLISSLKRKYGGTVEAVLSYAQKARKQLEEITSASEQIETLSRTEMALLQKLGELARQLSHNRRQYSQALAQAIEEELAYLHMEKARFRVQIEHVDAEDGIPLENGRKVAFNASGIDRVEFLIAPNPGEGFKPLAKIASGGETSRLMLALKSVLASADDVPCLVFDEIDQGIGGRTGAVVGKKLWQLARHHQVFCVTHLPQLAAFGDQHFLVRKRVIGDRTVTEVQVLAGEQRVEELAQMMGDLNAATLQSARKLLQSVSERVAQISNS